MGVTGASLFKKVRASGPASAVLLPEESRPLAKERLMRHHPERVPCSRRGVLGRGHRRNSSLSVEWYPRAVLFVADIDRTLDFYVNRLGFTEQWHFRGRRHTTCRRGRPPRLCAHLLYRVAGQGRQGGQGPYIHFAQCRRAGRSNPCGDRGSRQASRRVRRQRSECRRGILGHRVLIVHDPD